MIFVIEEDDSFRHISFDELKAMYPKTSFCVPLKQSALFDNLILANPVLNEIGKADSDNIELRNKKKIPSDPFLENGDWFFEFKIVDPTEEELEKAIDKVDFEVSKLMSSIQWAFDDDIPERLKDKYLRKKKEILRVYDQKGFPFHVNYPEIE